MATKVAKPKTAKAKRGKNGVGHNSFDPKKAQAFFDRLHRLHDEADAAAGEARSDIKEVYEEAANKLGIPRKVLRMEFGKDRSDRKREAREGELEPSEREALERLRGALGDDTPLGKYAGKLAEEADDGEGAGAAED